MKKPLLSELTLREKIGQTALMESPILMRMENPEEYLKENPIGNVWHTCNGSLSSINLVDAPIEKPEDTNFYRNWTKEYGKMLKVPPIVGLDGPGPHQATDIPSFVNEPVIGAVNSEEFAYNYGKYRALAARTLGANWIWSPNVDIASRFSFTHMRTLTDYVDRMVMLGGALIKGMQDNGVAASIKHFPGKDMVEYRNSHYAPTYNHSTMEEWHKGQGVAFKELKDDVWSVMVGHHGFPALDDRRIGRTYRPATISKNIITGLLKEELGFDGVIVTDAIDMAALKVVAPNPEDLYVELFNAGNDMLLKVETLDYIDLVEKAVKDGRISIERIDEACRKILDMKEKIGLFDETREEVIMTEALYNEINEFNRNAARKSITLECNEDGLLPVDASKVKNVAIVGSSNADGAYAAMNVMKAAFEKRGMNVTLQRGVMSNEAMEKIDRENDLIVYASYLMHEPVFHGDDVNSFFYAMTKGMEKSIGVSLGSVHVYYDYFENSHTFIHAYSVSPNSQEAVVDAIFGDIPFEGTNPMMPANVNNGR